MIYKTERKWVTCCSRTSGPGATGGRACLSPPSGSSCVCFIVLPGVDSCNLKEGLALLNLSEIGDFNNFA